MRESCRGYVLGSYSARKLGMATTGNAGGVHNLVVADTGAGYADLLAVIGHRVRSSRNSWAAA